VICTYLDDATVLTTTTDVYTAFSMRAALPRVGFSRVKETLHRLVYSPFLPIIYRVCAQVLMNTSLLLCFAVTMVETTLTNPGIIDRLEQDITDYLSPFGFSIERQEIVDEIVVSSNNNSKCNNNNRSRAVLTSPSLPEDGPICTMHLHIHNESLIPTIGPLLRTYLRLSSPLISPIKLRCILHCNFTLDPISKYTKMNTTQQNQVLKQQEELSAKKIIQHIHMIIRNSMGAALCIELVFVLPCYWRRRVDSTTDESSRLRVSISTEPVRKAMQNNLDACYPSVQLVEQSSKKNMDRDNDTCLHLDVKTRMCTVRHQPLLFRWLSTLDGSITNDQRDTLNEIQPQPHDRETTPLIVACIEKVANLHRILMLLHGYDKSEDDNSTSLFSKVVIVLPNGIEKDKTLSEFNDAIDNFHKVIIDQQESHGRMYRPTLVYEDQAVEKISSMIDTTPPSDQPSIIGIDLHPDALTFKGDYRTHPSSALQQMRESLAIVFGYESTGIPEVIRSLLNSWVQIPSRSSINVVAAMSIILDALMDNKV